MDLFISVEDDSLIPQAQIISKQTGLPIKKEDGFCLFLKHDGLYLKDDRLSFKVDFRDHLYRIAHLQNEKLLKVAKTRNEDPLCLDLTAGLGEDSFLLAAGGYRVILYEKNPVIAALLKDGMKRGMNDNDLGEILKRMTLICGDSIELSKDHERKADLVYLDPMFPKKNKSSLVNKRLQLLQKLEEPCKDEEELLAAALDASVSKVIIKRPLKGPFLAGRKPDYSSFGKAIRYDCILVRHK